MDTGPNQNSKFSMSLKKLKLLGFSRHILENVYRSLGLNHLTYSAPIISSVNKSTKAEISSFHRRILRIIDIRGNEFENIHEIMDENNRRFISRILSETDHTLTRKLQITRSTRSRNLGFKQNLAKSKAYSNSLVQKYLRALNNNGLDDLYTNNNKSAKPKLKKPYTIQPKETHKLTSRVSDQITTYKIKPIQNRVECNICGESYKIGTGIVTHKLLSHLLK